MADVYAVDREAKVVLFDDGKLCPFSSMYNDDGVLTEDPNEAVTAVVCECEGRWHSLDLRCFTKTLPTN